MYHHQNQSQTNGRYQKSNRRQGRTKTPAQGQPCRSPTDRLLLISRSTYKNISLSLINVQTQASFLMGCLHYGITTPGLKIRTTCMAARPDLSPIKATFSEHIHQSERGTMFVLVDHFITSSYNLKQQLHSTLTGMDSTSDLATPTEVISHQRFLSATTRNIQLEAVWRQKDSNRKLQTLRQRSKPSTSLQSRYSSEPFSVCLVDTYDQDNLSSLVFTEQATPSDAHPPQPPQLPQFPSPSPTSISTTTSTTTIPTRVQRPSSAYEQKQQGTPTTSLAGERRETPRTTRLLADSGVGTSPTTSLAEERRGTHRTTTLLAEPDGRIPPTISPTTLGANEQRSSEPINLHQLAHQFQSDEYPAQQHQQAGATTSEQSSTCLPGLPFRKKKTVSFSLPPEELPDALFADEDTLHSTIAALDQTSGLGSSLQSLEFTNNQPPTPPPLPIPINNSNPPNIIPPHHDNVTYEPCAPPHSEYSNCSPPPENTLPNDSAIPPLSLFPENTLSNDSTNPTITTNCQEPGPSNVQPFQMVDHPPILHVTTPFPQPPPPPTPPTPPPLPPTPVKYLNRAKRVKTFTSVLNLSNHILTPSQSAALELGLKFAPSPTTEPDLLEFFDKFQQSCGWAMKRVTGGQIPTLPKPMIDRLALMKEKLGNIQHSDYPSNISPDIRKALLQLKKQQRTNNQTGR